MCWEERGNSNSKIRQYKEVKISGRSPVQIVGKLATLHVSELGKSVANP